MKTIAIYNPNINTMGGGEKVCLALAEILADQAAVTLLTHEKVKLKKVEAYFGVDLSRIDIKVVKLSRLRRKIYNNRYMPDAVRRLLRDQELFKKFKKLKFDIFINNAYNTELSSPAPIGVYMCMFPHKLLNPNTMGLVKATYLRLVRLATKALLHPAKKSWLDTYQHITANSEFTKRYVQEYWGRDSQILYPICDAIPGSEEKRKIILNVGRFFHNNGITHHKRQDFLIDAFSKMADLHRQGWELHFAGTINDNYHDMVYAIDLLQRAESFPVYFHFGAPLGRLQQLYRTASIYWHATGYGVSSAKFPERQEHFGISTVEAMSAGAVPVVINSAGQKEIVVDGDNGFLWSSPAILEKKTRLAIEQLPQVSARARQSALSYDRNAFRKNCAVIFSDIL